MRPNFRTVIFGLLVLSTPILSEGDLPKSDILDEMAREYSIEKNKQKQAPVFYDYLMRAGYFQMPSARMFSDGDFGVGYGIVDPYIHYNIAFQAFPFLSISTNYRVFKGVEDPVQSPARFTDKYDRGINLKLLLIDEKENQFGLPSLCLGFDDAFGTKLFYGRYLVATKNWIDRGLELSVGFGEGRYKHWFGGVSWTPNEYLGLKLKERISLVIEQDAYDYRAGVREPHLEGRVLSSRVNYGIKYRPFPGLDFGISRLRGEKWAGSIVLYHPLGGEKETLIKLKDPLYYKDPVNFTPVGTERSFELFSEELSNALSDQKFYLLSVNFSEIEDPVFDYDLSFQATTSEWFWEDEARLRMSEVLARLLPDNVRSVCWEEVQNGLAAQNYFYTSDQLDDFYEKKISYGELQTLTKASQPLKTSALKEKNVKISREKAVELEFTPLIHNVFGSSSGKYKYAIGILSGIEGSPFLSTYYKVGAGYYIDSTIEPNSFTDSLNPSQLLNVRSDLSRYTIAHRFFLDSAYGQFHHYLGKSTYGRLSVGMFERMYGGVGAELLWYPPQSIFAVGLNGAYLKKRSPTGLGFEPYIRKLEGFRSTYSKNHLNQGFIDLFFDLRHWAQSDIRISLGRFLAHDLGGKLEYGRDFSNGLRIYAWYTRSTAKDYINGDRYFDLGFGINIPLHLFSKKSRSDFVDYSLATWLRDLGARSKTGKELYPTLHSRRHERTSIHYF